MLTNIFLGANGTIALCYFAIALLIVRGMWRKQLLPFQNPLVLATVAIFASCALGHLVHVVMMTTAVPHSNTLLMSIQVGVDLLTAIVALAYLGLRRYFSIVIDAPLVAAENAQLSQVNDKLETLVAERTAQLQQEIRDRQQIEAALTQSEQQYRTLADNLPDSGIFLFDHDLRYTLVSGGNFALDEASKQHFQGKTLWEALPPETCVLEAPRYRAALAGSASIAEVPVHDKIYRVQILPIKNDGGEVVSGMVMSQDITEIKLKEAALQQSEARLKLALAAANMGYWDWDLQNDIFQAYESDRVFCGFSSPTTQPGFTALLAHVHSQDKDRVAKAISLAVEEGAKYEIEYRVSSASCRGECWIASKGKVFYDDAGVAVRMISTVMDISKRKRTEQALQDSEARAWLLFNRNPQPMWVYDLETLAFLEVNEAATERYGYPRSEFLSMKITDIRPAEDVPALQQMLAEYINASYVFSGERRHRHQDGTVIDVEVVSNAITFNDRKARLVLATDITDRKRQEVALRESEERLRLVVQNMPVMMDALDENGNIVAWNQECERVTGYSYGEMVGNPQAMELLYPDPEYRKAMFGAWRKRGNNYQDWEWQMICKDGSQKITSWSSISDKFPIPGWSSWGIGIDISDRKREQALLAIQNQVLEKIATGANLLETLNLLTDLIESQLDQGICSILLLNEDGTKLYPTAGNSIPPSMNAVIADGFPLGPVAGSCGTAAYTKQSVIVSDIATDPLWDGIRQFPLAENLHACWSTPILNSSGDVLGTFAIYYRNPRSPREYEYEFVDLSVYLAGIAIERQLNETERKRAEAALQESNSILRGVIENTTDAIFMKDLQSRYIVINSAGAEILGLPAAEIIGKDDSQLFPDDLATKFMADDREIINSQSGYTTEEIIPSGEGVRTLLAVKTPCRNEQGEIIGLVGIARDISDRKQTEQALRDALQKLNFHFENNPLAVIEWDNQFRVQRWSQQAEKIFGWQAGEVIGKNFADWEWVYIEDQERVDNMAASLADGSNPRLVCANRNYTKDRQVIDCEWYSSALVDDDGNLVSVLSLVQDVTERNRIQAEIQELNQNLERRVCDRTAQLEAANQELEAFSYSVSHDLRAPLRSIDGFSLALLERYESQLDDKGKHYLQRVRAASQRMAALIDDMLTLSRVTRSSMQRQKVDLSQMVTKISTELQQSQPERVVEFIIAPNVVVQADERLLYIALENLLNNAWKFTSNQVDARIEFGVIDVTPSSQISNYTGDLSQIYFVRDNGAGFDMTYADKLFGAFQRLHTVSEFPGTGVGLATVQRIINRHGGQISAEAAVNAGATFYFCLPAQ